MVALSEAYHNSILISTSFYPRRSFEIGWYQEIGLFRVILGKMGWVWKMGWFWAEFPSAQGQN